MKLDLGRMNGVIMALLVVVALFGASTGAFALDLQSAKAQGLVGEQADGYLGIPSPPGSDEVQKLVADINLKRRAHYQEIATGNGTTLDAVEALAGQKLVQSAKSGEYVRGTDNVWIKVK
ncbi:MAG: YdbL family protein [Alphaproteobacteria bacterium]